MIRVVAFILRCWWWLYYAAWNAGEFIVSNPLWLTRHTFQMLIIVNAPVVLGVLDVVDVGVIADGGTGWSSDPPSALMISLAQFIINLSSVILLIDKIVISALVFIWLVHMTLTLFAKE